MATKWNYRVVKSQRGMDGQWFSYPTAATFETEAEAREYAEQFAAEQASVGGTKIDVFSRRSYIGKFGPTRHVAEYHTQPRFAR